MRKFSDNGYMETKKKMEKWQAKIEMSAEARDALQQICDEEGMLQIQVISRLLTWFLQQGKIVRAVALGHVVNFDPALLRAIVEAEIKRQQDAALDAKLEAETVGALQAQPPTLRGRKAAS